MKHKRRTWGIGLGLGALTVALFGLGMRLGPGPQTGHNLLSANAAPAGQIAPADGIVFASTHPKPMTAQAGAPAIEPGDASADDVVGDGPAATFLRVYLLLKSNYVDAMPPDTALGHGAAAAMLSSLQDPNSRFLEPAELAAVRDESKGIYSGIGAVTAVRKLVHPKDKDTPEYNEYRLTVVAPLPDSPSAKAGIQPGDVITAVNGQWVATYDPALAEFKALKAAQDDPVTFNKLVTSIEDKEKNGMPLTQAESKLDDATAKSLTLTVERAGQPKPLTLTLDTSTPTTVTPVASRSLAGGIGYIKIHELTDGADAAFDTALSGLGMNLKGLVLDLRHTPGGTVESASAIAGKLSSTHILGRLRTKGNKESPIVVTPGPGLTCPVIALVNDGTANTAELLASALQEGGAKLIGTPTFGNAGDMKLVPLHDGSGFTMTVGEFLTASGHKFAGIGIKPDIVVPDTTGTDEPLNRALGALAGQVAGVPVGSRG